MVNILVLGGGGREMAIEEKLLSEGHTVSRLRSWESNLLMCCKEKDIKLVIPGSESYLCDGIVDYLAENIPEIKVFGPNIRQAKIESSKKFSKELMDELGIPTPKYEYFAVLDPVIFDAFHEFDHFPVVKYSGLAKGKGVFTSPTKEELYKSIDKAFKLGSDGIILEERISGKEVSILAFCNGKNAYLMPQVQDYKRIYDGDDGPNTGGMGVICPANILTEEELKEVKEHMDKIVQKLDYKGVLYAGIMKEFSCTGDSDRIYFLEFNCRFGDPETQALLNLLDSELYNIMVDCLGGCIPNIEWKQQYVAGVVLSHVTYPAFSSLPEPVEITYVGDIDDTVKIYKPGVITSDEKSYAKGGRVLTMVSRADELHVALENVYNNIHKIRYDGAYYRKDIGCNLIKPSTTRNLAIGVLASGNGTSVGNLLEQRKGFVRVIITDREDANVIEKARRHHIPFVYIPVEGNPRVYFEKIINILRTFDVELVILSGFMRIVPAMLFDEFFTINIHPSLLPKYSGTMDMDIHNSVIKNGDLFSGCTLHRVTKDVDKGRILMQKQYEIGQCRDGIYLKQAIQWLEGKCILEYVDIYNRSKINYSVNIQEGNAFVNDLKKIIPNIGGFCGEYVIDSEYTLAATTDGVGTKLDLAIKYNKLDTIGIDLVAMNVNDLIAGGAVPLFFMDYIALDKIDKAKCNMIIGGIQKGCQMAECKLIGGETAEMKGIYMKNKLDLAGFAIGIVKKYLPNKKHMTENCLLYGLESSGIHSNGYTLVNKLLKRCNPQDCPSIENILEPTRIYTDIDELYDSRDLSRANTNLPMLGRAHITGGGFRDNLPRILPDHLTYELIEWEFPDIFKWIQKESKLSREEMLATFNCGYGMVIVAEKEIKSPMLTYIGKLIPKVPNE